MREAIAELLGKDRRDKYKPTMTNGGKAYDALIVTDADLVEHLEVGWEIVNELSSGQIAMHRPAEVSTWA